jgi:hypothetical protein
VLATWLHWTSMFKGVRHGDAEDTWHVLEPAFGGGPCRGRLEEAPDLALLAQPGLESVPGN